MLYGIYNPLQYTPSNDVIILVALLLRRDAYQNEHTWLNAVEDFFKPKAKGGATRQIQ